MSEVVEGGAAGSATAGQLLREARQGAGLHIAALAVALKVPVSKLEALEADNYAALPDTVFVRALASSICRTLKVDPGPILLLLPQSQSPRLSADSAGLNAPVKASAGKSSSASSASYSSHSSTRSRSVSLVVLILLVGAVAVYLFPREPGALSFLWPRPATQPEAGVGETASVPPSGSPAEPTSVVEPVQPNADVAQAVRTTASSAVAPAASVPGVGVGSAAVPPVTATASEPANAAAAAATGTLVLRAKSQSWVQVKDASGAVVLQRNLAAEESVSVSAPAPLAVVVGRADATEVFVRGKAFDLAGVSRENVARFEVK